jgi:alpha-L-rhamnosidase
MRPEPVGDLTYVMASHLSPHGRIASHWRRENGKFHWHITVPVNTTATVFVPATSQDVVTEDSQPAAEAAGVKFVRMDDDRAVFEVDSGDYRFKSQLTAGSQEPTVE